ncbi:MAG: biotin/lipoyl-binding protein [Acidobacteriaceae bacterium]|nr:biotin/lipoyl-binding protein [Acidobacteriaceae bacterium]MBV9500553.1 biotin/lipoyl-binding protein [Acidobacteriaceae bacterium]
MKLRVTVDGEEYALELRPEANGSQYRLEGATSLAGSTSIFEVMPGVFSVLLGTRSFTVRIASNGSELEVWSGSRRHWVSVADTRDRSGAERKPSGAGPVQVRAQMPGKVMRVLVELGASVQAGQGLVIVEAMKMQNEMKSPKDGVVRRINVKEGGTVGAGETLIVVE